MIEISTALSAANIARISAILAGTASQLESLSSGLSAEQLRQPLGRGERSLTENLAHLLNSEEQWSRVIRQSGKKRKESVFWRARTLALHELEHLADIEVKLGSFELSG